MMHSTRDRHDCAGIFFPLSQKRLLSAKFGVTFREMRVTAKNPPFAIIRIEVARWREDVRADFLTTAFKALLGKYTLHWRYAAARWQAEANVDICVCRTLEHRYQYL